ACFAGLEWLSLSEALPLREVWSKVAAEDPDGLGACWHEALLPFASDGGRAAYAVNLDDGRTFDVNMSGATGELARDFGALLEMYAAHLEAGEFVVTEEGLVNRWLEGPGFDCEPTDGSLLERLAGRARPPSDAELAALRAMAPTELDADLARRGHSPRELEIVARLSFEHRLSILGSCLPRGEAFEWAITTRPGDDRTVIGALGALGDARLLDWLERAADLVPKPEWSSAAHAAGLDWSRASSWIARGRPLSLIALDALALPRRTSPHVAPLPIADRAELRRVLDSAAASDPSPRVRKAVADARKVYGLGA